MHIGIDPGLTGAVAVLDAEGALVALDDTPTLTLRTQSRDTPGIRCAWPGGPPDALHAPTGPCHPGRESGHARPGHEEYVDGRRRFWAVAGYTRRLDPALYQGTAGALEADPGPGEGQRARPAQSHAAFPWCRSAAQEGSWQSRGVTARVVRPAAGFMGAANLLSTPPGREVRSDWEVFPVARHPHGP